MTELIRNTLYLIELCSGEQQHWRYRGPDARGEIWWQDSASGGEFSETSLMYAWKIIGRADEAPTESQG
ncbi:hypothetical protein ACLIKD_10500 [Azonexus sp. IMCC34842]|uniref:hypothetical protein n=1 Tax=Azonexus sp. IMCC34842 TaxID=3420950 RepID=UPI003D0D24C3